MRKKPFNRGENKDGRNLRKSSRGGIALPGQTDISAVFLFSRHCCQVPAHEGNVVSLQVKKKNKGVFSRPAQSVVRRPVLCIGAMQIKFDWQRNQEMKNKYKNKETTRNNNTQT